MSKECKVNPNDFTFEGLQSALDCQCDWHVKARAELEKFRAIQDDPNLTEEEKNDKQIAWLREKFGGKKGE